MAWLWRNQTLRVLENSYTWLWLAWSRFRDHRIKTCLPGLFSGVLPNFTGENLPRLQDGYIKREYSKGIYSPFSLFFILLINFGYEQVVVCGENSELLQPCLLTKKSLLLSWNLGMLLPESSSLIYASSLNGSGAHKIWLFSQSVGCLDALHNMGMQTHVHSDVHEWQEYVSMYVCLTHTYICVHAVTHASTHASTGEGVACVWYETKPPSNSDIPARTADEGL